MPVRVQFVPGGVSIAAMLWCSIHPNAPAWCLPVEPEASAVRI
ncbi:Uncharacterized protein ToN1_33370 [Aromatoleum petrolei]|nr:Uncharacterized protein ToN1_33370 [Aromatoleum petrolei]